jgi:hypothetical protein
LDKALAVVALVVALAALASLASLLYGPTALEWAAK